jgi:hypothetical protein
MPAGRVVAGDRRRVWLCALLACMAALAILLAGAPTAVAAEDEPPNPMENEDVLPVDQIGRYSLWRYEVGSGDPGALDIDQVIWAALTELFFWGSKGLVAIGEWVIEQAYSFDLVQELTDPAVRFADSLQREFVGPLGLNDFALFLAVAYSGYQLYRRRTALGLGELVISLLVVVFGAMLVAQPAWLLRSALPYTIDLSTGLLEVAMSLNTTDPTPGGGGEQTCVRDFRGGAWTCQEDRYSQAVRPLTSAIQHALIEQPYDLIAWGALLEGDCAVKRDEILANDDWDPDSADARNHMRGGVAGSVAGALDKIPDWLKGPAARAIQDEATEAMPGGDCAKYADYNAEPTVERMGLALVNLLVTVVVISLLVLVALTVVGAQLILAGHLVAVPFAVALGTVPGTGRQLLVKWGSNVGQAYVVILAMSFLLAMLLVGTAVILGAGDDRPLGQRYLVLLLVVCMIFRMRKRLVSAVQYMTIRAAQKLQTRDVHGRTVGVASAGTPVLGLESAYAMRRMMNARAANVEEYNRTVRKEVESLWE